MSNKIIWRRCKTDEEASALRAALMVVYPNKYIWIEDNAVYSDDYGLIELAAKQIRQVIEMLYSSYTDKSGTCVYCYPENETDRKWLIDAVKMVSELENKWHVVVDTARDEKLLFTIFANK